MFTSFLNPISFMVIEQSCYHLGCHCSLYQGNQDGKTNHFENNTTQRNRNASISVSFCDHGNTELTAEIKDAPRGADSCHSGSGSNRRNGTEVSETYWRSVPGQRLALAVTGRRKNATGPEIIPSCGRSGAWLQRWTNGDFIYRAPLRGWPA